jgi:hypothetical protein
MNNLFSYCGLVDARISASEKDLPVLMQKKDKNHFGFFWIFFRFFFFGGGGQKFQNYDVFFMGGSLKIRYYSIWGEGGSKKNQKIPTSFMDGPLGKKAKYITIFT